MCCFLKLLYKQNETKFIQSHTYTQINIFTKFHVSIHMFLSCFANNSDSQSDKAITIDVFFLKEKPNVF